MIPIAERLRALRRLAAESPVLGEREAAAAAVRRIVELHGEDGGRASDKSIRWRGPRHMPHWEGRLITLCATGCGCMVERERTKSGHSEIVVTGPAADVEASEQLTSHLLVALKAEVERWCKGSGRHWRESFKNGAVFALSERLPPPGARIPAPPNIFSSRYWAAATLYDTGAWQAGYEWGRKVPFRPLARLAEANVVAALGEHC